MKELPPQTNNLFQSYADCIRLLTPRQQRDYWIVVVLGIAAALLEMIGLVAIIPIISILVDYEGTTAVPQLKWLYLSLGTPDKHTFLLILMMGTLSLVWLSALSNALSLYANQRFLKRIGADLAVRVYKHYMLQTIDLFYSRPTSEFLRNVNGISARAAQGIIGTSITIIVRFIQIAFVITALLTVNYKVTLILILVVFGAYIGIFLLVKNHVSRMSTENMHEVRVLQQLIVGSYQAYRSIFINGLFTKFETHFKELKASESRKSANIEIIGASPRLVIEVIGISMLVIASFAIGITAENSRDFVAIMALFGIAAYRMLPAAQQIYHGINTFTASSAAYRMVAQNWGVLDDHPPNAGSSIAPIPQPKRLTASGISYSYGDKQVLKNLSIDLELKGLIRISGASGAGKSTLMDILAGLRTPNDGEVKIDGDPLSLIGTHRWWSGISYLSQHDYIFHGSIKDNVALDGQNIDERRLENIAEICDLGTISKNANFDPNQEIGEGGTNLSGGQKNRILLARALYKKSHLVFLDEAFSATDLSASRLIINKMLQSFPDRCFIAISHRAEEFTDISTTIQVRKTE